MRELKNMTTLCYIESGGCWLMMHRIKKKEDLNRGKWIGVGGHFLEGERPEECLLREVREETGLNLTSYRFRGIVTFVSEDICEYMHLFTADGFLGPEEKGPGAGRVMECREGVLQWVPREQVPALNLWEGDRIFMKLLLEDAGFFSLKLEYHEGQLTGWKTELY